MARSPMITRLEEKLNEARSLKECLNYLHPIAAEHEFMLCAEHILQARNAAQVLEDELTSILSDLRADGGPDELRSV